MHNGDERRFGGARAYWVQIAFIINNLSSTNMDQKVAQFREALKPEFYPWFAQYLIGTLISFSD